MANHIFGLEDLESNPSTRIPVNLCLDVSDSMSGMPIQELNAGVSSFYNSIKNDPTAFCSAEVAVTTFGGDVKTHSYFTPLYNQPNAPQFSTNGDTPMGEAVNMALDMLERRKNEYKLCGVSYYQPWLVLMSDGQPNGSAYELQRAKDRATALVNENKLTVIPIGIGPNADMNALAGFSPRYKPMRLQGLNFREFFQWLSMSMSSIAKSSPNDTFSLDLNCIKGWAEL
ncbi:MAG: VWA domain-containing protein [Fibrobacter sp.]|nr:VWA domain-containing protein [Fibrobacter sp.]